MTQSTVKESNMKKNNDAQGYVIKKEKLMLIVLNLI